MKIGVILTGIIDDYHVDKTISCYKKLLNYEDYYVIISTWNYIDENVINKLRENGFLVILSEFPDNIFKKSVNFQHYSYSVGIEVAKNNNCTHVIRIRSDQYIKNIESLLKIYQNIYVGKPIFIAIINHVSGYLIDHIYMFDINFYNNFTYKYQEENDDRFPEKYLQETYFGTSDIEELKKKVTLSIRELIRSDVELIHIKRYYQEIGDNRDQLAGYIRCGIFE
jgi:predicted RNA-binding protein with RPS1 domain